MQNLETRTFGLICQRENVGIVACFEGEDIVVLGALENLCERTEVDTEGNGTVAAVTLEAGSLELDGDEGDMGVIHGLECLET